MDKGDILQQEQKPARYSYLQSASLNPIITRARIIKGGAVCREKLITLVLKS